MWNAALEAVASERPELIVWDWATLYAGGGFPSGDRIHLSRDAYVERNRHIVDAVTATMVSSEFSGTPVALPPETATPAAFTPITPRRVLDTRKAGVSTGEEGVLCRSVVGDNRRCHCSCRQPHDHWDVSRRFLHRIRLRNQST